MCYTYYQAKNPSSINIQDEHVTESELPDRLLELNNKTQNINDDGTALSNITSLNGNKIGIGTAYNTNKPFLPFCDENGVIEIGTFIDFHDADCTGRNFKARLMCYDEQSLSLQTSGTASNFKIRNLIAPKFTLLNSYTELLFVKTDGTTSMLTLNANTNLASFLGNVSAPNITTIETNLTGITYADNLTTIAQDVSITGKLNGNRIGASDEGFGYNTDAPFIPICKSNGILEIGRRIDFHPSDTVFRDFSIALDTTTAGRFTVLSSPTGTVVGIEVSETHIRNSSGLCRMTTNSSSNILWYNNAGNLTWICDASSAGERWSTTRDNSLAAFTRTTGMTHTPAVVEPSPAPAYTTFTNQINAPETYVGRYHTTGTSSLPINSVAPASTWGAMRIQRTGLAKDARCSYQFGRGGTDNNYSYNNNIVGVGTEIIDGEFRDTTGIMIWKSEGILLPMELISLVMLLQQEEYGAILNFSKHYLFYYL